jgi:molecular chaperone GrpE (heat shock protein)
MGKEDSMKLRNQSMKYNLQFFAEDGAGADGGNGDGQGEGTDNGNGDGNQTISFDDFLKDSKNQSEFDKRVAKAIETRQAKWQAEYDQKIEAAKSEAAKLAKMTADQKAEYERQKNEADYQKRLAELTERELKATAKETLVEEGLPVELADVLNYKDADSCKASIDSVKKAFQSAVEKSVNDKLRGSGAPKGAGNNQSSVDTDKMSDAEFYAYMASKKKG